MPYKICQRFITQILCLLCIFISIPAYADIDEIKARGKLRIGICTLDQPPFYYHNKKGELVGIDIDIMRAVAHDLAVEPEFIVDREKWDDVVQDVGSGRTDIAASNISNTPKRSLITSFSLPYAQIKTVFMLNKLLLIKAFQNDLYTLKQIFFSDKFNLLATNGSSYNTIANRLFMYKGNVVGADNKNGVGLKRVLDGEELGYFTNEVVIENKFLNDPTVKLRIVAYPLEGYRDQIAIPVSYDNPILLSLVNSIITTRKMRYSSEDIRGLLININNEKKRTN